MGEARRTCVKAVLSSPSGCLYFYFYKRNVDEARAQLSRAGAIGGQAPVHHPPTRLPVWSRAIR